MAREILFKGKMLHNNEWIHGGLVQRDGKSYIVGVSKKLRIDGIEIDTNTLCQYTGLTDKNGNKIWENDILSIAKKSDSLGTYYFPPVQYPVNVCVRWDMCSWMWEVIGKDKYYIHFPEAWCHYESEVIGNSFDNPELLGGGE